MSATAVTPPNAIAHEDKSYLRVRALSTVSDMALKLSFNVCLISPFREDSKYRVYESKDGFDRKGIGETPLLTSILDELEVRLSDGSIPEGVIKAIWGGAIGIYCDLYSQDDVALLHEIIQMAKEKANHLGDRAQAENVQISGE